MYIGCFMRRRNHCNRRMNENSQLLPFSKNNNDNYHQRRYFNHLPSCIAIAIICILFSLVLTNKHFQGISSTTTIPFISSSSSYHENKYIHPGSVFLDTQNPLDYPTTHKLSSFAIMHIFHRQQLPPSLQMEDAHFLLHLCTTIMA